MKSSTRTVLWIVALVVVALVAILGTGAFIILTNLRTTEPTAAEAFAELDALRNKFPPRPPLIEIDDPLHGRVHVNRPPLSAPPTGVTTFEVLAWKAKEGELVRTHAPLWLMRFSTLNLLSRIGLAPASIQLTIDDVLRYGPGVVVDFTMPKGDRVVLVVQ